MIRVDFAEAKRTMEAALLRSGFVRERAALSASLFAVASLEGVYTHGLERFPRFVEFIAKGWVDPVAEPVLVSAVGALERWDGRLGPGNLNALTAMDRACALARDSGIGCVALGNTNHWMRGGQYGLRAAENGCIGLCWTNTTPNLPAWGGLDNVLGNNPLVMAVPRADGPVLLDMALSQFSWGKMEAYAARGEELPVAGGWDEAGSLSRDARAVAGTRRAVPVGFWKGSGLSLLLDLVGAILTGGASVGGVGQRGSEHGLGQVFVAFDPALLPDEGRVAEAVEEMASRVHGSRPVSPGQRVRFPGESRLVVREENLAKGIPLREELWAEIRSLG